MPTADGKPEKKWRRTLRALLERSEGDDPRGWLNRMLAEKVCSDHTLPSTVSELMRDKGIAFDRQEIEVSGYAGEPARVMAYRVSPCSIPAARALLSGVPAAGIPAEPSPLSVAAV
jgi:hypothetical protein